MAPITNACVAMAMTPVATASKLGMVQSPTPDHSGRVHMEIVTSPRNFITRNRDCVPRNSLALIAKHPCKNRVDMLQVIAKIELRLDFRCWQGGGYIGVSDQQVEQR